MIQFTDDEKRRITEMVAQMQQQQGGISDRKFAVRLGISNATLTYIKKDETRGRVGDSSWLALAQAVGFTRNADDVWHFAETKVSKYLFTQFAAAQQFGATAMMADEPGIGKTFCMKEYARTHAEVMCIDCSVNNTKASFIRAIAQAVGVTPKGRLQEVLDSAIYAVKLMDKPLFIFDEAGDLEKVLDALAEVGTCRHCPNVRLIGFQRCCRLSHPLLLFGIISFNIMVSDPILSKQCILDVGFRPFQYNHTVFHHKGIFRGSWMRAVKHIRKSEIASLINVAFFSKRLSVVVVQQFPVKLIQIFWTAEIDSRG